MMAEKLASISPKDSDEGRKLLGKYSQVIAMSQEIHGYHLLEHRKKYLPLFGNKPMLQLSKRLFLADIEITRRELDRMYGADVIALVEFKWELTAVLTTKRESGLGYVQIICV